MYGVFTCICKYVQCAYVCSHTACVHMYVCMYVPSVNDDIVALSHVNLNNTFDFKERH